ncbi:MAG: DUF4097 domain-containing protein [Treponema sp.]|jgi:DUF4097 and DUF4098 domain-containing protein YvlB|nr:DUF4097 domain-containing protein [Treponema sp.]
MKRFVLIAALVVIGFSAYCGGLSEEDLVNEKIISLDGIHNISISYQNDRVTVLKSDTSSLILKEYMSEDKLDYYAKINTEGGNLSIDSGRRPIMSYGNFFARAEIYVPEFYDEKLSIKTDNGSIIIDSVNGMINARTSNASINVKNVDGTIEARTSNGSIDLDSVKGNVSAQTSNGSIDLKNVDGIVDVRTNNGRIVIDSVIGNTNAETSSGSIVLTHVDGAVDARSSNGSIRINSVKGKIDAETSNAKIECTLDDVAGDITLSTNNASIDLNIPSNMDFQFTARTTNGRVRTSFDEALSRSANDDHLYRGIVGRGIDPSIAIDLKTENGSILVDWN